MAMGGRPRTPRSLPPDLSHILDLLAPLGAVNVRAMFGGWALSQDGLTFAIMAGDRFYLKVDDSNRAPYVAHGCQPFTPYPDRPHVAMGYYPPPAHVLEEAESLLPWARDALTVAIRAASARPKRRR